MGQPKQSMVMPDGRTMIEHVADTLQVVCDRVIVVTATVSTGLFRGYSTVSDLRPNCGPLGGIESLLANGIDPAGQYLICPCDVPLLTPELLRLLLKPSKSIATVFQVEGRDEIEPLPARISADALPVVRAMLDQRQLAVWKLMEKLQPEVVVISVEWVRQLRNVNTLEDWGELR